LDVQRQIGNAVPSLLAEVLGREIRAQFFDHAIPAGSPTLLPKRKPRVPPPEPLQPVPSRFLVLAGPHSAHPGTGRGFLYERSQQSHDVADDLNAELL
jgi:DNA (cytosine-5)-methyltransferase 1